MVTVPALGPEWKASELLDMTKRGKSEKKSEKRWRNWKRFNRGQMGLCGQSWLTRRVAVFIAFGVCALYVSSTDAFSPSLLTTAYCSIGIILAFTIPRVPGFALNSNTPLAAATGDFNSSIPTEFSRIPANFSFPAFAELQVDTNSNFLPLKFNSLHAQVFDLDSFLLVGIGEMGSRTLPAKTFTNIQLPLNISYLATNDSDQTCNHPSFLCVHPTDSPFQGQTGMMHAKMWLFTLAEAVQVMFRNVYRYRYAHI
jgi:hypothetical protein